MDSAYGLSGGSGGGAKIQISSELRHFLETFALLL